jgi:hypothetical protein
VTGTFDVDAAIGGLAEILATITEIDSVRVGTPVDLPSKLCAWVALGEPELIGSTTVGIIDIHVALIIWLGYRITGASGTARLAAIAEAERATARVLVEIVRRVNRNRYQAVDGVALLLNGSVDRMELPRAAVGGPDYAMMSGQEGRLYPLGVPIVQREPMGV